jgi:hypothetical protein
MNKPIEPTRKYEDGEWKEVPSALEVQADVKQSILQSAHELINGQRRKDYGHPSENFADIAAMWAVILGAPVAPEQVILCMIALKMCRLKNSLDHADSWLDVAGYVGCAELVLESKNGNSNS